MGIEISKIPFPNQDVSECILKYLSVDDARELMITSKYIHHQVVTIREFWLKRAQQLFAIDPAHFRALKDPSVYEQSVLVKKVCEAHIEYCAIKAQIFSADSASDVSMSFPTVVDGISVDTAASLMAVATSKKIEIFSLLEFGSPAIVTIDTAIECYRQIVLHGDFLFLRPPVDEHRHHFDVYNWASHADVCSVVPRYFPAMRRPLKKSEYYLATYILDFDGIVAYSLGRHDDFNPTPVNISYDRSVSGQISFVYDYDVVGKDIFLLIDRDASFVVERHHIPTGQITEKFLVASPSVLHEPRLAYPHVLIAQKPLSGNANYADENFRFYGVNIVIDDPGRRYGEIRVPRHFSRIRANMLHHATSSDVFFHALVDYSEPGTRFVFVGENRFRVCEYVDFVIPTFCFEPFGLSIIYARGNNVTLVRFYDHLDSFSLSL